MTLKLDNLPVDILRLIFELVIVQDIDAFRSHSTICKRLRCTKVDSAIEALKILRLLSRPIHNFVVNARLASLCVRIGSATRFLSPPTLSFLQNLAHTISLEIDVGYLKRNTVQVLLQHLSRTPNLLRLSIDASFITEEEEYEFLQSLQEHFDSVPNLAYSQLSSVLIHVPLHTYELLLPLSKQLQTAYITTFTNGNANRAMQATSWPMLSTLCVYFASGEQHSTPLLQCLTKSSVTNLEVVWFSYDGSVDSSLLLGFLSKTRNTVKDLTLLARDRFMAVSEVPASDKLSCFTCYFFSAHHFLGASHPNLKRVILSGFSYDYSHTQKVLPGMDRSTDFDSVLWNLWTSGKLKGLHTVQLEHPLQTLLLSSTTNIFETAIYSYWSAALKSIGTRFIDCDDYDILPDTWTSNLQRHPPDSSF